MAPPKSQSAEVAKKTPDVQVPLDAATVVEKAKKKAEVKKGAHEKETALQDSIQAPAQRKIEVITGVKPDEMNSDFTKLLAAIKGFMAFLSGDPNGMEEIKKLFLSAGAPEGEIEGALHDTDNKPNIPIPPIPPVEEDALSTGDEQSKAKRDPWNPEELGLDRENAWEQYGTAKFALRKSADLQLEADLDEAERKFGIPKATIQAFMVKEAAMDPKAVHKYKRFNKKTGKMELRINARGLAQAQDPTLIQFGNEHPEFKKGKDKPDPFDPKVGIMLTAWYIKKNMKQINAAVEKGSVTFSHYLFSEKGKKGRKKKTFTIPVTATAHIEPHDIHKQYLCHNSGPYGFLAQCYLKDALKKGDQKEIAKATEALFEFQQEVIKGQQDWKNRAHYALETAAVAYHIDQLTKNKKAEKNAPASI